MTTFAELPIGAKFLLVNPPVSGGLLWEKTSETEGRILGSPQHLRAVPSHPTFVHPEREVEPITEETPE